MLFIVLVDLGYSYVLEIIQFPLAPHRTVVTTV
jgi:hypothetical protein